MAGLRAELQRALYVHKPPPILQSEAMEKAREQERYIQLMKKQLKG